ncbi:hypothetical protein [Ochrobactrum sp. BTU1]|uniref:hypothetical protein n=1 Tax=Ochrobactrum sp. BTU1 TaxID=2840456 RepID=UPI001C04FF48|nr:hypothetical protein KMS41_14135 [Ochrobactrum sp. BTU1]
MKRLILISALLTATSAWADDKASTDKLCAGWGGLAAKIMELRQDEAPMSRVMEIAAGSADDTRERNVVMAAYNEPAYGSDGAKQEAVDAFRNKIELECYKSVK